MNVIKYLTVVILFFLLFPCVELKADSENREAKSYINSYQSLYSSEPEKAVLYLYKAYDLYSHAQDSLMALKTAYSIAKHYLLVEDMDKSLDYYYKALNYCPIDCLYYKPVIYIRLGSIYNIIGDYDHAIKLVNKGISIAESIKDSVSIADGYNILGLSHTYKKNFEYADTCFTEALQINSILKSKRNIAANINNMCLYKGDTFNKIELLKEAIFINDSLNEKWALAENYNNLGMQYCYAGMYEEALDALSKAKVYAKAVGSEELICDNYEYQANVHYAIGDYKKAYDDFLFFHNLQKDFMMRNKVFQMERKIAQDKLENEYEKAKRNKQEYVHSILTFTICTLFILIIISLIYWGNNIRKKKELQLINAQKEVANLKLQQQALELDSQKRNLESAKKDLTNFVLFINSRNEVLDNIRDMIKNSSKKTGDAMACLKTINSYILQVKNIEKSNENLIKNIDERNSDFLNRLIERHPNLTNGERKLASFLRVNLSTKEIALLTGISIKAVSMARYRLRKALKLSPQDDIVQYLHNL